MVTKDLMQHRKPDALGQVRVQWLCQQGTFKASGPCERIESVLSKYFYPVPGAVPLWWQIGSQGPHSLPYLCLDSRRYQSGGEASLRRMDRRALFLEALRYKFFLSNHGDCLVSEKKLELSAPMLELERDPGFGPTSCGECAPVALRRRLRL